MQDDGYYTLRGYNLMENHEISAAMEDYLEMICRLDREGEPVRVNRLAALLNVTPSSSSKMVNRLKDSGMVDFYPYGAIRPTEKGGVLGAYLLRRHDVLHRLFRLVNGSQNELELVEKVEHFFDRRTVENLERLLQQLEHQNNP